MDGQMNFGDITGEKIILEKELLEKEEKAKEKREAINRASSLINDARARYVKEKTRARSKKAAEEKDAILNSPRFEVLNEYDKRNDIREAYGWEIISEAECDRLEDLWDERERIRNHVEDGIYTDLVTKALNEAWIFLQDLWHEEIDEAAQLRHDFDEQVKKARIELAELYQKQNETYNKLMEGNDGRKSINS